MESAQPDLVPQGTKLLASLQRSLRVRVVLAGEIDRFSFLVNAWSCGRCSMHVLSM